MNATATATRDLAPHLPLGVAAPASRALGAVRGPLASAPGLVLPQAGLDEVKVREARISRASRGRRLDQAEGALFALLFSGFALMAGSFTLQYLL